MAMMPEKFARMHARMHTELYLAGGKSASIYSYIAAPVCILKLLVETSGSLDTRMEFRSSLGSFLPVLFLINH